MLACPCCGSAEDFCESPDLEKGEVDKYYCLNCGYESTEIGINTEKTVKA